MAPAVRSQASAHVTVLVGLLEDVVDEVAELVVILGEADAVGLLGERVADQLEGSVAAGDQAQ